VIALKEKKPQIPRQERSLRLSHKARVGVSQMRRAPSAEESSESVLQAGLLTWPPRN
jgi:hypothetical protein